MTATTMKTPSGVPRVPGLDPADQDLVAGLMGQLSRKAGRNRVRRDYYDLRQRLKDLGIALPKKLKEVDIALGWPAKGVDELVKRTSLDGFSHPEADVADLGVADVWESNHLETQVPQALVESAICSVAFCSLTAGDTEAGEPEALWSFRSGEFATGTWDPRVYGLRNALTVYETDNTGGVVDFALYVPDRVVWCRRQGRSWDVREVRHELGVPVEPLVYRQRLQRPFGSSRISRAVMYLTDAGIRTALRSEVSYEYFSAPQRYALGVTEDAFQDEDGNWQEAAFESIIGRILALTRDENGDLPEVGSFPQITAEPNMAALRTITQLLAAELNMPVSAFGIVQDNPASAEAIHAVKEDMVIDAVNWQRSLGPALCRQMGRALAMRDASPEALAAYRKLKAHWVDPSTPSVVSLADAFSKQAAVIPGLAETEVGLELSGMTRDQIVRYMDERRRARGAALVGALDAAQSAAEQAGAVKAKVDVFTALLAAGVARDSAAAQAGLAGLQWADSGPAASAASAAPAAPVGGASEMKAQFDALGVAVRAGVDPADAARRLGLSGIEFTGAVPVALRLPEKQAASLEEA